MNVKKMYPSRMTREIYEDPAYWLGSSLFAGVLFSTWSWGIVYLILFILLYEFFYCIYCQYSNKKFDIGMRIGLVAGAFMGFLIGRSITGNDNHQKSMDEFCDYTQNLYKRFGHSNKHNKCDKKPKINDDFYHYTK